MDLFRKASKQKLRFTSSKGELSVEQLWDLPLTAKAGHESLDTMAVRVYNELKNNASVSFVKEATSVSSAAVLNNLRLDILREIIAVKQEEQEAAKHRADRAAQRAVLGQIIAEKKMDALKAGDLGELERMYEKLA